MTDDWPPAFAGVITLSERRLRVECHRPTDFVDFATSFAEEICWLVSSDEDGSALILKTYLDETGIHDGAPVTAVAAYFSDAKRWKVFTRKWLNAMRPFGIDEFHMTDYAQRHKAFEGWTAAKQNKLAKKLFHLIPSHTKFGVSVAMVHADFDEIAEEYPNIKLGLGSPYACCFQWLMSFVVRGFDSADPSWRVGCIHEDNDYKQQAIEAWDFVKNDIDTSARLGTLAFASKKDCVPLQAADVLAWESQKALADPDRPERKSLSVLRKGHITIQTMNKDWLRENAPRLDALAAKNLEEKS